MPATSTLVTTPAEARTIAKEAYAYGFPIVDGYRIQHAYCVDRANPEFKAPWNEIRNIARVFTPEDTAVQTPNSDTPVLHAGDGSARRTSGPDRTQDRKGTLLQRSARRSLHVQLRLHRQPCDRKQWRRVFSWPGQLGQATRPPASIQ